MIKLASPKESICFNFENDYQKNFFDKAKKSDIIRNNNSIFLRKILSVKNQSLLEETLKKSKSQIFNHLSTSTYDPKNYNMNLNNSSSNLTIIQKKVENTYNNNILSPQVCLNDVILNNSFKIEISPKKDCSPKIVVNKNKNLGFHSQKEKEIKKEPPSLTENTIFSEKENNKIFNKYGLNTVNTEYNINPEICFSNLYTKNYIRKPVVIKFKNNSNNTNMKNNENAKEDLSKDENKENVACNNQQLKKVKIENKIKPYNFYKKNNVETELYRSFEDLEKKSLEISKRKMKKNSKKPLTNFKKENNLEELKESFEKYRIKSKNNMRRRKMKKENFINNIDNNKAINDSIKINTNNRKKNINMDNKTRWHRKGSLQGNALNFLYINDNKFNKRKSNDIQIPKVKSEELLLNNLNYENMKRKSIKINFIEEDKTENVYNITLNPNNENKSFNRFHMSLNYDQNFKYKNYIIRQKYGKKHNTNENSKIQEQNQKIKKQNGTNKTLLLSKKYIEDNKVKYNMTELTHCFSQDDLMQNETGIQIKVNKKNNRGKRLIKINSCQNNIDDFLDLEDKINKEINNHLNIINGIDIIKEFLTKYNKKILKKKFILFCGFINQIGINNNTTLLSNISQLSDIKYIKKIVHKENPLKTLNVYSTKRIMRNKSFNMEKQKVLLIKRKEFGFFEKYEHYLDFINKLRILLIKYSSS